MKLFAEWFTPDAPGDPDDLATVKDSFTDTTTTVWLSKGRAGVVYTLTNRVTSRARRVDDRSTRVQIR
jgi:hypothetical protein